MQKDFHYNMTLALAVKAGIDLETAKLIAWSNQFTDECKDFDKYGIRTMVDITWKPGDCFVPEVQRSVFVPFHFLPGSKNSLVVKPDSDLARTLVDNAIRAKNPIANGIALHSYQDTFSHQLFTGTEDKNNAKHGWDMVSKFTPNIGHSDYRLDPDIIGNHWSGPNGHVINIDRFFDAAFETFKFLIEFSSSKPNIHDCEDYLLFELDDLWKIKNYNERKRWLMKWAKIADFNNYSVVDSRIRETCINEFVAAAKQQQSVVMYYLS